MGRREERAGSGKARDIAVYGGTVYTFAEQHGTASAVLCRNGRVAAVGDDEEVLSAASPDALRLDAEGGAILPGFTDCHVRFSEFCLSRRRLNLEGTRSAREVAELVALHATRARKEAWVLGRGWSKDNWAIPELPSKRDLDATVPDIPVALWSKDGHVLWVNSAALRAAKVTKDSPVPLGGEMARDPETLEPSGIFKESAAALITDAIGAPSIDEMVDAFEQGIEVCLSRGVVAVHDFESVGGFEVLQLMAQEDGLGIGFYVYLPEACLGPAKRLRLKSGFGAWPLKFMGIEMRADGSLGSQTAYLIEPYEGKPNYRGVELMKREDLQRSAKEAVEAGLSLAIRAVGDGGVRDALDALAFARESRPAWGRAPRHRIENLQLVHPKDLPRVAQLGAVASMQPSHAPADMDMAAKHWGARVRYAYAWKSILDSGAVLAFGSGAPVEDLDPLKGIYAAVARKRMDEPEKPSWNPAERLSVEEAIGAFTVGAAYAVGLESERGVIAPGFAADLVVLDRDIVRLGAEDERSILDARVRYTIVGGELAYSAG